MSINVEKFPKGGISARQSSNTFQTPTRESPKFRHVGSFLVLEARCGLFLLLVLLLVLPWELLAINYYILLNMVSLCKELTFTPSPSLLSSSTIVCLCLSVVHLVKLGCC